MAASPSSPATAAGRREFAVSVVRRLQRAGYTAYWAGGCVRDLLRGEDPSDFDVATSATPEQVRSLFGQRHTLAVGASFGVILVRGETSDSDVEVATFRTDGLYIDGRRPESVQFATPEQDAQRRDFTINGLFYDPLESRLYDYVGGQADLDRRLLRAIGDPVARFTEDKLRMLRAVRLSARFEFELEEQTALAVRQMASQVVVVSAERIAQELRKILLHRTRRIAIDRADWLGLLHQVLPELTEARAEISAASSTQSPTPGSGPGDAWRQTLDTLGALAQPSFELAVAALLEPLPQRWGRNAGGRKAEAVLRRLKLSNAEIDKTRWLLTQVGAIDRLPNGPLWQWKELLGQPWIPELLTLERGQRVSRGASLDVVEACEEFLRQTPAGELRPPPLVTGDDLIQRNFKPGKGFKELLRELYRAQLDGRLTRFEQFPELMPELLARGSDASLGDLGELPP